MGNAPPTDKDLDAAFIIADEDKGGTVDIIEFLHIYELIKSGEIIGIGGTNLSTTSPRQKDNLEKKQLNFRKTLEVLILFTWPRQYPGTALLVAYMISSCRR